MITNGPVEDEPEELPFCLFQLNLASPPLWPLLSLQLQGLLKREGTRRDWLVNVERAREKNCRVAMAISTAYSMLTKCG